MTTARFTAVLTAEGGAVDLVISPAVAGSSGSASLTAKATLPLPTRHLVWVYNLAGTKVDVIA